MEKKKLLLVSVSVGLFLVIVIGASILVFSPRDYPSVTKAEIVPISPGTPRVAVGVVSEEPKLPEPPEITVAPAAGSESQPSNERSFENVIYINGENAENAVRVERLNDGNTKTIITIPSPHENVIKIMGQQVVEAGTADTSAEVSASAGKPAVSVAAAKPSATVAAAAPAKTAAAPAKAAPETKTEKAAQKAAWWVQTNSYSKKAYADNAKKFLESKGITSVIMNGIVGGKTFYRVRVGPYSSQAEANYWLSLIKTIEGMENSLVWKSSSL
jgi:DedD protein